MNFFARSFYGNYRIVYRLKPEAAEIVTVFHGARLFRIE